MASLFPLYCFCLLCVTVSRASPVSVEFLTLYQSAPVALSHSGVPVAVSVGNEHLREVSSSVLAAESWVRTHVLSNYPAVNITAIVVGHKLLCEKDQGQKFGLVLPSIKNIYHSLTRWGLDREIKVSASFSSDCLRPSSATYRIDLAESVIKPLLRFLLSSNSNYLVNPPSHLTSGFSEETLSLLNSHAESVKKLGISSLNKMIVIVRSLDEAKPTSRKLTFFNSSFVDPLPLRSSPLAPVHSPFVHPSPANGANIHLPPLASDVSPPPPALSMPFVPQLPPLVGSASPSYGPHLPPCNPSNGEPAAAPVAEEQRGLWCVAKPGVPSEVLQEAIDYACGEGDADCEDIRPNGSCYFPDNLVAHASYAFNNYWQKNKRNGGSCGFGGTAMVIGSDPSYGDCRFVLT